MSDLNYTLAVLTHGQPDTIGAAVSSFARHVRPDPDVVVYHHDGMTAPEAFETAWAAVIGEHRTWKWRTYGSPQQAGFCESCERVWRYTLDTDPDFVFWLEHDFVFTRDVDLSQLAVPLALDRNLAQMALMRDAVNDEELAAGGLYELRRDQYTSRGDWLDHRAYFTSNPMLMTSHFMRANPWPDVAQMPSECEGRFGAQLVERGYHYGVWGDGQPWVRHVGERTGWGY